MKLVFIFVLALSAIVAANPQDNVLIAEEPEIVPEQKPSALPADVAAVLLELSNAVVPEHENVVLPEQIPAVLPEDLTKVLPELVNAVVPEVINAVVPEVVNAVVPEVINAVVPEAVAMLLPHDILSAMPAVVNTVVPEVLNTVVVEELATALPEEVMVLPHEILSAMPAEETTFMPEETTPEYDGRYERYQKKFETWLLKYPQKFKTPEGRENAMKAVIDNWVSIKGHNSECTESGEACDFYRGLWEMSHLTQEEKLDKLCGSFPPIPQKRLRTAPQVVFPTSYDTVLSKNYVTELPSRVTPVQNQGQCGICWGMTATGVQEGVILKTSTLTGGPLSWQQILDCDATGFGCSGGYLDQALVHLKTNGQSYLSIYPYGSLQTLQKGTCQLSLPKSGKPKLTVANWVNLNGDEKLLKNYLLQYGPVGIQVQVVGGFTSYRNGTYIEPLCKSTDPVNHSMLLVGFGTDALKQDYWLIKNTWGTTWGEQGYIKMVRNRANHCNIANYVFYAS